MKKSLLVTFGFIMMIMISLSFTRDEPRYKNLKILPKNITKEEMDSVMHHFSLSLGVRCNFCHVHNEDSDTWDMASDEKKHKLKAREMMSLTQKINDKYFDVAGTKGLHAQLLVTCYTCHHGSNDPATIPPRPPVRAEERKDSTIHNTTDSTRNK